MRDHFAHGVSVAPLAAITGPDLVAPHIAAVMGPREGRARSVHSLLIEDPAALTPPSPRLGGAPHWY